jgi:hypothetical protein
MMFDSRQIAAGCLPGPELVLARHRPAIPAVSEELGDGRRWAGSPPG